MEAINPKIVMAYLGHDPQSMPDDFARMNRLGVSVVVLPISEEHMEFQVNTYHRMVDHAHHYGMEAWLSPWGLLGVFGGEGITAHRNVCPHSCTAQGVIEHFTDIAQDIKADGIHWDEPRDTCCDVYGPLADWIGSSPLERHLYTNTELWTPDKELLVNSRWHDWYNTPEFDARFDGVWIRGFKLTHPTDMAEHVHRLSRALRMPYKYVGIWAFDSCRGTSLLESAPIFWESVENTLLV